MTDPAFWPWLLAAFLLGLVLGIGVAALLGRGQARRLMGVMGEAQRRHEAETDALLDGVKLAFHDIGRELAGASRDDMLRLAQTQLAGERRALGHTLEAERGELAARIATMLTQLERTQGLIRELERDRTGKFQALATQLRVAGDSAAELGRTTRHLARSLSGAKLRGQLGERLAEDVLKAMGLTPGIHYTRQAPLDAERRPDFLLALGDGRRLAMDVKFPLDNWRRAVEAADEETQARLEAQFMRDVRAHVAAVASRGYAAPELGTHDFALLFVPSDALLAAILDLAPDAIESAARQRVALVGPSTLYALLAALRMARARSWPAIGGFRLAWTRYAERAQRVERRLEDTLDELRKLYGLRRATVDRAMATVEAVLDGAPPEPDTADEPQDEAQGAAKSASFSGGRALTSE